MACFSNGTPTRTKTISKKHGLSFDEATELFTSGTDVLEIYDEQHSDDEDCFIAIGSIRSGVVVVIQQSARTTSFAWSVRKATKKEVELFRKYHEGINE